MRKRDRLGAAADPTATRPHQQHRPTTAKHAALAAAPGAANNSVHVNIPPPDAALASLYPLIHPVTFAVVLNYVGTPYQGLQLQPTTAAMEGTVEGNLLLALNAAGLVTGIHGGKLALLHHLSRGCRTDRGVHAVRNVVTLVLFNAVAARLMLPSSAASTSLDVVTITPGEATEKVGQDTDEAADHRRDSTRDAAEATMSTSLSAEIDAARRDVVLRINRSLPDTIQVAAIFPVTRDFRVRAAISRRVYQYLLPAYALDNRFDQFSPQDIPWHCCSSSYGGPTAVLANGNQLPPTTPSTSAADAAASALPTTTTTAAVVAQWIDLTSKANAVLRKFEGRHRFHNFTDEPADVTMSSGRRRQHHQSKEGESVKATDNEAIRHVTRCRVLPVPVFLTPISAAADDNCSATPNSSVGPPPQSQTLGEESAGGPAAAAAGHESRPMRPSSPLYFPYFILQIEGESFLLHMIRKIVGLVLAIVRGHIRETMLDDALLQTEKLVSVPLAPPSCLLLNMPLCDSYDFRDQNPLKFPPVNRIFLQHRREVEAFLLRKVYTEIATVDLLGDTRPVKWGGSGSGGGESSSASPLSTNAASSSGPYFDPIRVSEMKQFIRKVRAVHIWNVRDNPDRVRTDTKRQLKKQRKLAWIAEEAAKRKVLEDAASSSSAPGEPPSTGPSSALAAGANAASGIEQQLPPRLGFRRQRAKRDYVDDGWLKPRDALRYNETLLVGGPPDAANGAASLWLTTSSVPSSSHGLLTFSLREAVEVLIAEEARHANDEATSRKEAMDDGSTTDEDDGACPDGGGDEDDDGHFLAD